MSETDGNSLSLQLANLLMEGLNQEHLTTKHSVADNLQTNIQLNNQNFDLQKLFQFQNAVRPPFPEWWEVGTKKNEGGEGNRSTTTTGQSTRAKPKASGRGRFGGLTTSNEEGIDGRKRSGSGGGVHRGEEAAMDIGREEINTSGVTVVASDAPSDYHISPRTEPPITGATPVTTQVGPTPPPLSVTPLSMKKKRGRPRKYGLDGSVTHALSPKPISSSAGSSPVIDFSTGKRGKIRLPSAGKQSPKMGMENLGDWFSSVGANFTPHIINVNTGEDVTMKVISFSQQGPRSICILSANGVISSVTLRQPNSSGGTLTYEGRFEILSLTGSFMPSESGGIRNRSGGMTVSLASPDGRVVGGSVAGLLVAASPVQIVVGSFLTGNQHEQKTPKTPKPETVTPRLPPPPTAASEAEEGASPVSVKPDLSVSSPTFRGDNWSAYNASPESRKPSTDINVSLH